MSLTTIIDEKKQWKALMRRVKAMPEDYQFVYKECQKYIFKSVAVDSTQINQIVTQIIEIFEEGISNDKHVLNVTSRDVAGFCDSITSEYDNYMDQVQTEVEASIIKAISKSKKK